MACGKNTWSRTVKKVIFNRCICYRQSDTQTSSILLVLHRAQMSPNCLNIPTRLTMIMAPSAVCDSEETQVKHGESPSPTTPASTNLRQWLEDKTDAHHHQKNYDRWQQTGDLSSEGNKQLCLGRSMRQSLGRCAKRILSFGTCVFPPVLSCTRLLDIEQVMAKVWKKELRKLQSPNAMSSWNTSVQITDQWAVVHIPQVILQKDGTTKAKSKGFYHFTTYRQKSSCSDVFTFFRITLYVKIVLYVSKKHNIAVNWMNLIRLILIHPWQ